MLSCKYFQVPNERYVFKEQSRIRISHHIHLSFHTHAHLDLTVWLNFLWIHCLTLQHMPYKYVCVVFTLMNST
jgi:hypothetical protein